MVRKYSRWRNKPDWLCAASGRPSCRLKKCAYVVACCLASLPLLTAQMFVIVKPTAGVPNLSRSEGYRELPEGYRDLPEGYRELPEGYFCTKSSTDVLT